MALSEWPEKFRDGSGREVKMVEVPFEHTMTVVVEREMSVGIAEDGCSDVDYWIPKSVIDESRHNQLYEGCEFDTLLMAKWYADDNEFEYE